MIASTLLLYFSLTVLLNNTFKKKKTRRGFFFVFYYRPLISRLPARGARRVLWLLLHNSLYLLRPKYSWKTNTSGGMFLPPAVFQLALLCLVTVLYKKLPLLCGSWPFINTWATRWGLNPTAFGKTYMQTNACGRKNWSPKSFKLIIPMPLVIPPSLCCSFQHARCDCVTLMWAMLKKCRPLLKGKRKIWNVHAAEHNSV